MSASGLPFPKTWWIQPGRVIGGCFPGAIDPVDVDPRLASLLDAGVTAVACLQEEDEQGQGRPFAPYSGRLLALAEGRGRRVDWARFPVKDNTPPAVSLVRAVLDRIASEPGVTYVHCWGGHGRTGVIAGCLYREQGLTAERALERIRQARAHDAHLRLQPAPQTAEQLALVRRWTASLS